MPGFNATVVRPSRTVLKGLDRDGAEQTVEGTGLLARAFQHEMDHLDGVVFVDRLRGIKRDLIVRKIQKLKRSGTMVSGRRPRCGSSTSARRSSRCRRCGASSTSSAPTAAALMTSSRSSRNPTGPKGRGHHLAPTPTKELALARGIPVLQPERLKDDAFLEQIAALSPDLGVVAAYGRLLPDQLLSIPPLGMVNVHASLLPRWRGAAPVHRAVIAGDRETGITIMRVVKELDAGASFKTVRRAIGAGRDERGGRAGPRRDGRRPSPRRPRGDRRRAARPRRPRTRRSPPTRPRSPRPRAPSTGRCRPSVFTTSCAVCSRGRSSPDASVARAVLIHRTALTSAVSPDAPGHDRARRTGAIRSRRRRRTRAARAQRFSRRAAASCPRASFWPAGTSRPARKSSADDRARARSGVRGAARGLDGQRRPAPRARPRAGAVARRARSGAHRRDRHRNAPMAGRVRPRHRGVQPASRDAKLDPEVLDILRSAIFQLLHLDRVPASAVVSDAVNMTRKAGKKSAGPFVNALLRRVSRERDAPAAARASRDPRTTATPRSTTSPSRSLTRGGWRRDGWIATASRRPKRGCSSTTGRRR